MPRIDQIAFYDDKLKTYGATAEGVAWDSAYTQRRRFGAIASCLGNLRNESLVDAGCGVGDFYLYLGEKGNPPQHYIGIDLHPEMVAAAKERTGCEILRRDILRQSLPTADWYVASGSMNLLTRSETGIFIRRCFEKSRKGFVFNLLEGKERVGEFGYWKPRDVIELCRPLGARVRIIEEYLEGDFTLFLQS
jgi:SAM-dependent methyltransferase